MLVPILLFAIGLLCLIKGGDWFVDGAVGLARRFHLPELLIGATIVSIGTTLPEVMVSATSAVSGHGEIAYGNAIGSIICNTALIAAITVAIRPGTVNVKTLTLPVAFFFGAAAVYCVTAYGTGYFSRPIGLLLLVIFLVYIGVSVALAPFSVPQSAMIAGMNSLLIFEIPMMLFVMAFLTVPALVRGKLSRIQGIILLCLYGAFCAVQFRL